MTLSQAIAKFEAMLPDGAWLLRTGQGTPSPLPYLCHLMKAEYMPTVYRRGMSDHGLDGLHWVGTGTTPVAAFLDALNKVPSQ